MGSTRILHRCCRENGGALPVSYSGAVGKREGGLPVSYSSAVGKREGGLPVSYSSAVGKREGGLPVSYTGAVGKRVEGGYPHLTQVLSGKGGGGGVLPVSYTREGLNSLFLFLLFSCNGTFI